MPNDMLTINALSHELSDTLSQGRIDKIYQPESDSILFIIYAESKNYSLLLNASGGCSHCNISNKKFTNPEVAPAFCMLLRKYLTGAKIESIKLYNDDRVLDFHIKIKGELFSGSLMHLLFEQMGKYANIVLCDENYVIKDALKRITMSETRLIMPSQVYIPEPLRKIPINKIDKVKNTLKDTLLKVALNTEIGGISKETERELLARSDDNLNLLIENIDKFINIYGSKDYKPCVACENGIAIGYYFTPYITVSGEYKYFDSLSLAIEEYFSTKAQGVKTDENAKKLLKAIKRLTDKYERRLSDAETKLLLAKDAEPFRQKGDLITANLHLIKKGEKELKCYDYFSEKDTVIPLDETLTPQKNAAAFYKRYTKIKRGAEYASKEKAEAELMLEYLSTVKESVNYCSSINDYLQLYNELYSLGGMVTQATVKKKTARSQFIEHTVGGFKIITGKNNIQNNEITFSLADHKDIWLHVKKLHGSHTIIKTEGKTVPDYVLLSAAEITAYFSEGRNSSKVDVDYTEKKNVKRKEGAPLGMVNYDNYKTVLVVPSSEPKKLF